MAAPKLLLEDSSGGYQLEDGSGDLLLDLAPFAGAVSQTQAAQTITATGTHAVSAVLSRTQAAETITATGTHAVSGSLSRTQASETLIAAAGVRVAAAVAATEAADTSIATAKVGVSAALSVTQASQSLSARLGEPIVAAAVTGQGDGWEPMWPPLRRRPKTQEPKPEEAPKPLRRPSRIVSLSMRQDDQVCVATATVETSALAQPKAQDARLEAKAVVVTGGELSVKQEPQRMRLRAKVRQVAWTRARSADAVCVASATVDWSGLIAEEDRLLTLEDWKSYIERNLTT